MERKSCSITIKGELLDCLNVSCRLACANCKCYTYVTIEPARVGIALFFSRNPSSPNTSYAYRLYSAPTGGEKVSISCVLCGKENGYFLRHKDGISFTLTNYGNRS